MPTPYAPHAIAICYMILTMETGLKLRKTSTPGSPQGWASKHVKSNPGVTPESPEIRRPGALQPQPSNHGFNLLRFPSESFIPPPDEGARAGSKTAPRP